MNDGAILWQLFRGIALTITGFLAAAGMSLPCALRNKAQYGSVHPSFIGWEPGLAPYLILFGLMITWVVAAVVFACRNRNPLGLALSAVAIIAFAASSANVLTTAYPACNAF